MSKRVIGVTGSRNLPEALIAKVFREMRGDESAYDVEWRIRDCPAGVDYVVTSTLSQEDGETITVLKADWDTHGKAAGPIRNCEVLNGASELWAIWDGVSKGTTDCIAQAARKGIPVIIRVIPVGRRCA